MKRKAKRRFERFERVAALLTERAGADGVAMASTFDLMRVALRGAQLTEAQAIEAIELAFEMASSEVPREQGIQAMVSLCRVHRHGRSGGVPS